jgi:beta-fructofuranosidase
MCVREERHVTCYRSDTNPDNPTANIAGNQHWGHATSQDLYTWTNQPIALFPGGPTEGVFSGSSVVDANNTSGFFPNQTNGVVAIYTINVPENQTQHIAYSYDGGYSFIKYEGNPVIVPGGTNPTQFRDPKVIWYEATQRWVMVVAYPVDFVIGIFSSPNLIDWTPESNFTHYGVTGLQYECPNMVEVPVRGNSSTSDESMYAMLVSINPGAPLGGSITEYFLGTFNGTHFDALDSTVRFTDFSKDNYAGQFFYGIPSGDDQITLNWASNWQYTNVVPTAGEQVGDGFRSAMTVPRAHYLKDLPRVGLSLISYPYNIMSIVESELASNVSLGNGTVLLDYSNVESGALYFEANITGLVTAASLAGTLNFTFSSSISGESISGGTFISSGDVWLDRGHTDGFSNPFFTDKFSATGLYNPDDGSWRLSGIIDRSIIEIFLNGGELSASSVFFPTMPLDTMALRVTGLNSTATASVGVWALKAAWLDQADVNGTVSGNVTSGGNSTRLGAMKLL